MLQKDRVQKSNCSSIIESDFEDADNNSTLELTLGARSGDTGQCGFYREGAEIAQKIIMKQGINEAWIVRARIDIDALINSGNDL